MMEPTRTCLRCKGEKTRVRKAFTYEGTSYPEVRENCYRCQGRGEFHAPDLRQIVMNIESPQTRGTKKPYRLQSKKPDDRREYFVWRMVRFHAGLDVTLPMGAMGDISGDPYEKELEQAATFVARKITGLVSVGAVRWANALGGNVNTAGFPPSAESGGPVTDENKPIEEWGELR